MPQRQKTTWLTKEAATAQREWWVVDLSDQILGRAATRIASVLRGKHKPSFTPNQDAGDYVIVLNAEKVRLTGKKLDGKIYRYHTGYMGSMREASAGKMRERRPEEMIRLAVWGMLPKGPLGRRMIKKLKIYRGGEHEHTAQKPREMGL
jgi:large subunit ribosomal protein L13